MSLPLAQQQSQPLAPTATGRLVTNCDSPSQQAGGVYTRLMPSERTADHFCRGVGNERPELDRGRIWSGLGRAASAY